MVELDFRLDVDSRESTDAYAVYSFTIVSCLARESGLSRSVAGTLAITYSTASPDALPATLGEPGHLNEVSTDAFYAMLEKVGYNYEKEFRGITSLKRGDNKAYGNIDFHSLDYGHGRKAIHPGTLDVALHSMIAAYTAPGDGRIQSLLVPTAIGRIALNPWVTDRMSVASHQVNFIATSLPGRAGTSMQGDLEVFDPETGATMLHVEDIGFKSTSPSSAADDHNMYTQWNWGPSTPDQSFDTTEKHATAQDKRLVAVTERITYWYISSILAAVTSEDREEASFHFAKYLQWCDHVLSETQAGRNVWYTPEWDEDTRTDIENMIQE